MPTEQEITAAAEAVYDARHGTTVAPWQQGNAVHRAQAHHLARAALSAAEKEREESLDEQLRQALVELPHALRWTDRHLLVDPDTLAGHEIPQEAVAWIKRGDVLDLLNDLQEQSNG